MNKYLSYNLETQFCCQLVRKLMERKRGDYLVKNCQYTDSGSSSDNCRCDDFDQKPFTKIKEHKLEITANYSYSVHYELLLKLTLNNSNILENVNFRVIIQ